MGLSYEVDAAAGVVLERWVGLVGIRDFTDHVARMLADDAAMACRGNLADLTACELGPTGEEIHQLVQRMIAPAFRERGRRVAVLVREGYVFGVARQFEVFTDTILEVQVFTDAAAARAWILGP